MARRRFSAGSTQPLPSARQNITMPHNHMRIGSRLQEVLSHTCFIIILTTALTAACTTVATTTPLCLTLALFFSVFSSHLFYSGYPHLFARLRTNMAWQRAHGRFHFGPRRFTEKDRE